MSKREQNIPALYSSYQIGKVKERGILVPVVIVFTVFLFTLIDYAVLDLPSIPFRLLAIVPLTISIFAFHFKCSAKVLARIQDMWIWGGNFMMAGLCYLVFTRFHEDLVLKYGTLLGYSIAIYISILVAVKSYTVLWAIILPLCLTSIGIYLSMGSSEWILLLNLYTVVIVSFLIVNQQHKQEFNLFKSRLQVQDLNSQLEEFAYMISHDLKSPISSASLQADILGRRLEEGNLAVSRERLGELKISLLHMDKLLDDILDYSKSSPLGEGQNGQVDLDQLLTKLLADLSEPISSSKTDISLPLKSITIKGNYTRLYQSFQNLIMNSINYSYPGRQVNISIEAYSKEKEWIVAIHDNGMGVPSHMQDRIFKPFERYHTEVKGSGLGLALVKRHMKYHKGTISMESEEGKGSTFFLHFPNSIISPTNTLKNEHTTS